MSRSSKDAGRRGHMKARPSQETRSPQQLKQNSSSPPSHHRSTGSLHVPLSPWLQPTDSEKITHASVGSVSNHRLTAKSQGNLAQQGSPLSFHTQRTPSFSALKEHKSHSLDEESSTRQSQRRVSEPSQRVAQRASSLPRNRLPSDPGLKVTDVDWQGETSEARFCLSPYATKAVKEYFSSHPQSNPQSSKQVALALVESRREWRKRCSDATAEPDFDQLLFAEESIV
ncbi:uncharacterized protein LOC141786154 [Halichoeres trimaculatus]|uniref:uncharacterized protein LOC141786154 n=1 Tax=Halichoeres trimaculatus TaxID=147232 RepID=UPI003D9E171C